MRTTLQKPWLWLTTFLLESGVLGWCLAVRYEQQYWQVFAKAWAGVSIGLFAVPLARPLFQLHRAPFISSFSIFLALISVVKIVLSLAIPGTAGNAIASITIRALAMSFLFVLYEPLPLSEKKTISFIFSLTVLDALQLLNTFEPIRGTVAYIVELAFSIVIFAFTNIVATRLLMSISIATDYNSLQSFQILALVFGIGLGLGWVTSALT